MEVTIASLFSYYCRFKLYVACRQCLSTSRGSHIHLLRMGGVPELLVANSSLSQASPLAKGK
jgi:hypothetical protein